MRTGQLEPHSRQVRAEREDRFKLRGRLSRHTEAHIDLAEQEASFDLLLFSHGPGLLQEYPRILESSGFHEQEGERQRRYLVSFSRFARFLEGGRMRLEREQDRSGGDD